MSKSTALRFIAIVAAVSCAMKAMTLFRGPDGPSALESPFLWFGAAALVFGAVAPVERSLEAPQTAQSVVFRRPIGILAVMLALIATAMYAMRVGPMPIVVGGWMLAQLLWMASVVPALDRPRVPSGWRRMEIMGVALLLAIAVAAGLWKNDVFPLAFHHDFASYGLQGRDMLEGIGGGSDIPRSGWVDAGRYRDPFGTAWADIPLIGFVPTAVSLALFGDSLAGLRTVPVIEGAAALLALYLLARELFSWRVAPFATALAAGDLFLLHYSRNPAYIDPVPFIAWSLYLLVRGFRRSEVWALGASGVLAGYALNMYAAGRIVLPLEIAVVAVFAAHDWRKVWRQRWELGVAAVGLVIVLVPSLVFSMNHRTEFEGRAQAVSIFSHDIWMHAADVYKLDPSDRTGIMREQLKRATLVFWRYGDTATQFSIGRNWLDPVAGVLLILGLGYAAAHLRQPRIAIILLWLGGYVAASALSGDPPFSGRTVGQSLPVALLCAVALDRSLSVIPSRLPWEAGVLVIGLVITAAVAVHNASDYVAWGNSPATAGPQVNIATFILRQPSTYDIRIVSPEFDWGERVLQFLVAPRRSGSAVKPEELAAGNLVWPDQPTIFILHGGAQGLAGKLQERYSRGRLVDGSMPPLTGVFLAFYTE
jgi:hypothetical protein